MAIYNPMFNGYQQYGIAPSLVSSIPSQAQYQIQNGGLISISSEEDARKYPVAPGNSVTFKDENAPYVYTKTMGFSQLDRPLFEKFRLVKEEDTTRAQKEESDEIVASNSESAVYLVQEDLDPIVQDIKNIQTKIKEVDSVLEELKSSCNSSIKQINVTNKSTKSTVEKGGK